MNADEKLAAILAAIQTDPGNRGLARDPVDNLFTACAGDFAAACRCIAEHPFPAIDISTGFFIPTAITPAHETDGPLGAAFLLRALASVGIQVAIASRHSVTNSIAVALAMIPGLWMEHVPRKSESSDADPDFVLQANCPWPGFTSTHHVIIEHVGPAGNGRCYSMRGRDITDHVKPIDEAVNNAGEEMVSIGIGDGGNEFGMGKIPHETIVKNIPNGGLIHCRAPTDHLIVAGVSNWGAYALAAGMFVLWGSKPRADLFDPDRERKILEVMVREGPLVDGVTGKQTATVDGLSWEDYIKPLVRIREILEA